MKTNIIFLQTENIFSVSDKKQIKSFINIAARNSVRLLGLKNKLINFTVYPTKGKYSTGITNRPDWIHCDIIKNFTEYDIESFIYHEMHHVARKIFAYSPSRSLLEILFAEGLATTFEIEQFPKKIPSYAKYTKGLVKKWLPKFIKQGLYSSNFDYYEWFWGKSGTKPKSLGYRIGTYFVDQIKKNNPNLTAAKLATTDTKKLLKLSNFCEIRHARDPSI